MKQSIKWHEDLYKDRAIFIEVDKNRVSEYIKELSELQARHRFHRIQIDTAKSKGLDKFNIESFLKRNRK